MFQAFGVGAFEEEDADIYGREDMSQYDFYLESAEERKKQKLKEQLDKKKKSKQQKDVIDGFRIASHQGITYKFFAPPRLPSNYVPVHLVKKSRFSELADSEVEKIKKAALNRQQRHVLIEEMGNSQSTNKPERSEALYTALDLIRRENEKAAAEEANEIRPPGTEEVDPACFS